MLVSRSPMQCGCTGVGAQVRVCGRQWLPLNRGYSGRCRGDQTPIARKEEVSRGQLHKDKPKAPHPLACRVTGKMETEEGLTEI